MWCIKPSVMKLFSTQTGAPTSCLELGISTPRNSQIWHLIAGYSTPFRNKSMIDEVPTAMPPTQPGLRHFRTNLNTLGRGPPRVHWVFVFADQLPGNLEFQVIVTENRKGQSVPFTLNLDGFPAAMLWRFEWPKVSYSFVIQVHMNIQNQL